MLVYQRVSLTIVDHTRRDVRPCSHHLPFLPRFFHTSLIQIHRDSLHISIIFTSDSIMLHVSHDVPYIELRFDILCFFHYRRIYICHPLKLYKGLIMIVLCPYKGLIMIVLCYMFFHYVIYFLPSYYIIAEGSKSAALQTKPRIRENQKFTSRTLPRLRGGLFENSGCFTWKNKGSGQTSGSVRGP